MDWGSAPQSGEWMALERPIKDNGSDGMNNVRPGSLWISDIRAVNGKYLPLKQNIIFNDAVWVLSF